MEPAMYRETKVNPLARQAGLNPPSFRIITLAGFDSQSEELSTIAMMQPSIHDIPVHSEYLPVGSVARKISQRQADFSQETERTMTIGASQPCEEETNPFAHIAGSYAGDPNWAEFIQAMEASRRELDEAAA